MFYSKDKLEEIAEEELKKYDAEWEKEFHSEHEGYAILKEEVEEAQEAMEEVIYFAEALWRAIRGFGYEPTHDKSHFIKQIYKYSIYLASEAIQCASMAKKFERLLDIQKQKKKEENAND